MTPFLQLRRGVIDLKGKSAAIWLLLLPTIIYLSVFIGYPLFKTFVMAMSGEERPFDTFYRMFHDQTFWNALKNTLFLTAVIVPIQLVLAIALALFINKKFRGYTFLLYLIIIPLALSDITAALMSYTMFSPMGYVNKILINLGAINKPIYFFGYMFKTREFWIVVLTEIWRATPLVFVIILAGLQSINKEYLEAADIFGFSRSQKLFKVVLPLLKPSIMSALLMRTLFAFQIFGVVWMLAGRDIPVLAGETYYQYTFLNDEKMAAAYSMIIAVITLIISYFYLTTLRSKHLEEGVR